jgi:carbon monoxide dehydrogenase subunit G
MVKFISAIEIKRPMADVFAFLVNPTNYLLWQSGLVEIKATDEMNVGSQLSFVSHGLGRSTSLKGQVTENNGRDHLAAVNVAGPIKFTSSYQLTALDSMKTVLKLDNQIEIGSYFSLAEPVLQQIAKSRYTSDLETLRTILEAGM